MKWDQGESTAEEVQILRERATMLVHTYIAPILFEDADSILFCIQISRAEVTYTSSVFVGAVYT